MAGAILESQLTAAASRVRFALAGESDDAAIRRLLQENPMAGEVTLSFAREPNYFLGTGLAGADDQTILAFEAGRLVCMGRCSVRQRHVNAEIRRVGYLGELRLDATARGRFDVVRRGYQFFRELSGDDTADFYFTSIAADNVRSIRLLERGLPGLPEYKFITDFVTLLIPVPRRVRTLHRLGEQAERRLAADGLRLARGSEQCVLEVVACLNSHAKHYDLAAFWTKDQLLSLERVGLPLTDFRLLVEGNRVVACAALWDQRSFRQTVIRGYSLRLSLAIPWLNAVARLLDHPQLPAIPFTLAHAFLSPLAVAPEREQLVIPLIEACLPVAAQRGMEFLTLGFAAADPRLAATRNRFRCREYFSRLYRVSWRAEESPILLDQRFLFPEIALL